MQSKNYVVYLLGCVFVMTPMYSYGQSNRFTDKPWLPQSVWNGVSIRDRFPNPFTNSIACNQLNQTSSTFFCDPNKILKNDEVTYSLNVLSTPFENAIAGLIVISKVHVLSGSAKRDDLESEIKVEVESFSNVLLDQWKRMKDWQNDTYLLLFVSCNDSAWYEAKGSTFLNGVEKNCRYLFNTSGPVVEPVEPNRQGCYESFVKPRMDLYAKLQAGNHPCQPHSHSTHYVTVIVIVVITLVIVLIAIALVVVYIKKKQAATKQQQRLQTRMLDENVK